MQKSKLTDTKIEYLDKCWNFYTGCLHWQSGVCPVGEKCWAYTRAVRFNKGDFTPCLHSELLLAPLMLKKPARIGVCFTGDLFGDWVDAEMPIINIKNHSLVLLSLTDRNGKKLYKLADFVKRAIESLPQHQFFFLTKAPQNLAKWGKFPDNAWVGATVCNDKMLDVAVDKLEDIQAKNKWISFEPLMERLTYSLDYALYYSGISWVVIGGWSTGKKNQPKMEWIQEILIACHNANIPVFMKSNLEPLLTCEWSVWKLRQEFPQDSKGVEK